MAFHLDGTYEILSAGAGLGFAYKWTATSTDRYPFELGFYASPKVTKANGGGETVAKVALLLHAIVFAGFGAGFGYEFWGSDAGTVAPSDRSLFFTLGYGITNRQ